MCITGRPSVIRRFIHIHEVLYTLGIVYLSRLSATIDLKDLGTAIQVHLGIFRPGVTATASSKNIAKRHTIFIVILLHWSFDVDPPIKCATLKIVATEDGTLHAHVQCIANQYSILTLPVHISLIHIARHIGVGAIPTAKDTADLDGRACRHIHNRTACNTLLVTATIGCGNLTAGQVDNGRNIVSHRTYSTRCHIVHQIVTLFPGHAQAAPGACTPHLHAFIILHLLRDVDEYITAMLHDVTVGITGVALTGTIDFADGIGGFGFQQIRQKGSEVHESLLHSGLGITRTGCTQVRGCCACSTCRIEEIFVFRVSIVVCTKATAKESDGIALRILHIRRHVLWHRITLHHWAG